MSILAPLLMSIFAVFFWFLHWHGYLRALNLKVFYFSFFLLSLFLWTTIKGGEFGFVYFFISCAVIGLSHLVESKHSFRNLFTSNNKVKNRKSNYELPIYKTSKFHFIDHSSLLLKYTFHLFLLIAVPFFTAASISLLLPAVFGIKEANILVASLFIFLISWSLLLTWVYMKEQRGIALGLLTFASIISFSTIYITAIDTIKS